METFLEDLQRGLPKPSKVEPIVPGLPRFGWEDPSVRAQVRSACVLRFTVVYLARALIEESVDTK